MVKKRGLGKSLDALLAYGSNAVPSSLIENEQPASESLNNLPTHLLMRGKYQPRRECDQTQLQELADSIKSQGVIQPLIVRPVGTQYEIIAGERRWRAAQLAGLSTVPAIIRNIPDETAIAVALIENIQRENLNPIEEAIALERLINEFGMTHQHIAETVGKSRTSVTNLLRLLVLPDEVKVMLEKGLLEMGHARTLITLPEGVQLETANLIVSRNLSVRETEHLVRTLQQPHKNNNKSNYDLDPDIKHLQEKLSHQLKLRVAIQCNAKGRGKLVIHYKSLAELNGILAQFQT